MAHEDKVIYYNFFFIIVSKIGYTCSNCQSCKIKDLDDVQSAGFVYTITKVQEPESKLTAFTITLNLDYRICQNRHIIEMRPYDKKYVRLVL